MENIGAQREPGASDARQATVPSLPPSRPRWRPPRSAPVGVIGTGAAGLITAHVLLEDGFENVTLLSRDSSVGGVWARERVYEGLRTNTTHGEYQFSRLPMKRRPGTEEDERLTGYDICEYLEEYSLKFLKGRVKFEFNTDVLKIWRDESLTWYVQTRSVGRDIVETKAFTRIVLATGGTHVPNIPPSLAPVSAQKAGFTGQVFHSCHYGQEQEGLISTDKAGRKRACVVIGGGKSAQDISAYMAAKGFRVTIVYQKLDVYFASRKPIPGAIRRSRLLSVLSPHRTLNTKLERFLHTTTLGSKLVQGFWKNVVKGSLEACNVPLDSPLRLTPEAFWSVSNNDEGIPRPEGFHNLVNTGVIAVAAPTRAAGFTQEGVLLTNGGCIPADVVVLATGYQSSWSIIEEQTAAEIGLSPYKREAPFVDEWKYTTLRNPPEPHPERDERTVSIHRGIVPAQNIPQRDFAIVGAQYTINPPYTNEVTAHWVSSYFLGDEMRLPWTPEEARLEAERVMDYSRVRYPQSVFWKHGSGGITPDVWTWIQAADELLDDMYLESYRSGGNWLTWVFKPVEAEELSSLHDERRRRRGLEQPLIS